MPGNARILRTLSLFLLLTGPGLAAESLPLQPGVTLTGHIQPILTLTMNGENTPLSLADLASLPRHGATMDTIWNMNGVWEGIPLSSLLDSHGIDPTAAIRLRAIDDYEITLGRPQIDAGEPLLAFALNGVPLAADAMGPLMLVWPGQAEAALAGTEPLTSWIWSIDRIEVVR
jgi:hypothetical protein